jgi:proteic killer suppression protein
MNDRQSTGFCSHKKTLDVVRRCWQSVPMATESDDASPQGPDEERAPPLDRDKRTARFANGERGREFQAFEEQVKKRLLILRAAVSREGLMLLPSNRFEALGGDRKGQFSIRINQQWRICFEWPEHSPRPFNIEIVDYH